MIRFGGHHGADLGDDLPGAILEIVERRIPAPGLFVGAMDGVAEDQPADVPLSPPACPIAIP